MKSLKRQLTRLLSCLSVGVSLCLSVGVSLSLSVGVYVDTISRKLLDRLTPNLVYRHLRSRLHMWLNFISAGHTWPEIWGSKSTYAFSTAIIFYHRFWCRIHRRLHWNTFHTWPEIRGQKTPMYLKRHFFTIESYT